MALPLPYRVRLLRFRTPFNPGELAGFAPKEAREMVARGEAHWVDEDGNRVGKPVKGELPAVYGTPAPDPEVESDERRHEEALAEPEAPVVEPKKSKKSKKSSSDDES